VKAIAYKDGEPIGTAEIRTAGDAAAIRLTPDRTRLEPSGDDLCYVLVEAIDEHGTVCPLADNLVHFELQGPGEIVAVGNGNPLSTEPYQSTQRKLFYGKAMLIVRTAVAQSGQIQVTATSAGLVDGRTKCEVLLHVVKEHP
jgi:beta-galactosidase